MAEKDFNVRSEIMAMIAKTTDDNMRMVWVIMLGLLEQSAAGLEEISNKIDRLLDDEESLRKSVLNGHEPTHHSDHDWIQDRRRIPHPPTRPSGPLEQGRTGSDCWPA